ncbi:hypothetical protein [Rhizobium laguerreae]|uniref:hypothetical protein n=1 Tax=Rhizobium laguerreae TaxID=1076926 RepID=UPI00300B81B2
MLSISEFFTGTISEASVGSFVLPRSKYDRCGIVTSFNDAPMFVILGDDHRFQAFPSADNTSHKGLIVPDVGIEIDETSIAEHDSWDTPLGSIVCAEEEIGIRIAMIGQLSHGRSLAKLASKPPSPVEASFSMWQITRVSGADKRILMKIDASNGSK